MNAHSRNVAADVQADEDSSVLVAMPLFHVGGMSYALCGVHAGARMVLSRMPDPAALLATLERERITHAFFVPVLIAMMVALPDARSQDYATLRALSYGASPMPLPVLRAAMDIFPNVFVQVYGMTEACGVVTTLGPAEHADRANEHRLISAGKPIPGVLIEVRDPASGSRCRSARQGRYACSANS
ncbi:MAG: AMP-binding protein [Actinomycetota bacterium]|nr:AMP-binding protein [Actinomycetota bacterium]